LQKIVITDDRERLNHPVVQFVNNRAGEFNVVGMDPPPTISVRAGRELLYGHALHAPKVI
jgi:hypothetical protein